MSRVSVLAENLSKAVSAGIGVARGGPLKGELCLIVHEDSRITVIGMDAYSAVRVQCAAKIDELGPEEEREFRVKYGGKLAELLSLAEDRIDLTFGEFALEYDLAGGGKSRGGKINGVRDNTYPRLNRVDGDLLEGPTRRLSLSGTDLRRAITDAEAPVQAEADRPALEGLHFFRDNPGDLLTVVGSSGFRVHLTATIADAADLKIDTPVNFTLHKKGLAHLLSLMAPPVSAEVITADIDDHAVTFRSGDAHSGFGRWTLTVLRIDATYPITWQTLAANRPPAWLEVDTAELSRALSFVMVYGREAANEVHLNVTPHKLSLETFSREKGDATWSLAAETDGIGGAGQVLSLNGMYLRDALERMGTKTVRLYVTPTAGPEQAIHTPVQVCPVGDAGVYMAILAPMESHRRPQAETPATPDD